MRRIPECIGQGKVRGNYFDRRAMAADAMDFLHFTNRVVQVFDHMGCDHRSEPIVGKRPGTLIEIMHDIRTYAGAHVNVDRPGNQVVPATEVQDVFSGCDCHPRECQRNANLAIARTDGEPRGIRTSRVSARYDRRRIRRRRSYR